MEEQQESKITNTYRLTDKDIRQLIQLRAANAAIFTGRKNSALRGWRAIRQEMGLQGVLSARQLKKKWDNLKEKYKILKNPPAGMDSLTKASSWPWFHMMDEAMSGRLACAAAAAAAAQPSPLDKERGGPRSGVLGPGAGLSAAEAGAACADGTLGEMVELSEAESAANGDEPMEAAASRGPALELYATLLPDCTAEIHEVPSSSSSSSRNLVQEALEVERKLAELQRERRALEREQDEFDRELICLERDRELLSRDLLLLERDRAAVERDRAAVERDRAAVERDRLLLDRDRAFLDRDRAFLERDRVFLDRAREDVDRKQAAFRSEKPAPEGSPATEEAGKEAGVPGRFYQDLVSAELDSEQLEEFHTGNKHKLADKDQKNPLDPPEKNTGEPPENHRRTTREPPENHRRTTREPQENHRRTTREPPENHKGTTREPPENHKRTTGEPPENHRRTTGEPPENHQRTRREPPENHRRTTREPPENHRRTTREPPENHRRTKGTLRSRSSGTEPLEPDYFLVEYRFINILWPLGHFLTLDPALLCCGSHDGRRATVLLPSALLWAQMKRGTRTSLSHRDRVRVNGSAPAPGGAMMARLLVPRPRAESPRGRRGTQPQRDWAGAGTLSSSVVMMESVLNPLPQFPENSYKMTEEDVKRLIEFRASNEALFTGKRNSSKIAWSTILKGLGLEGKLTADQIAKKWDNLRTKYKDLKQPYQGQDPLGAVVESWPWFHIMDEAMQGRLYNSSLVLSPESSQRCSQHNQHNHQNHQNQENQENTDILEFLIKTEMEDTVAAESAGDNGAVHAEAPPVEGVPMGWRRMMECSYKMTEPETERMIKLRAANEALFTGRKHSAKLAWRAILYELGLQGKLTTDQLAKKWDNLKRRYKELKFPARGVETNPSSWSWFYRMNDAMEGRFAGAAPILTPIVEDEDEDCESLSPTPKKRARRSRVGMAEFLTESEMDLLVDGEDKNGSAALGDLHRMNEFTYKLTEDDTRRLIELRAANESLFTGRRNTAKPAWRGIVKEMGLTGKITPDQVAKKWDNLKTKFKDLKFPPRGMEGQTNPASWPWFQLMSDALEGRLAGKAPRVAPVWSGEEDGVFGSSPPPDRDCLLAERGSVSELDGVVGGDGAEADGNVTFISASGEECSTPSDLSYKMTDLDTSRMIKLRAANESLFTGRRNAAKAAWKAILKELGLQGKVSTYRMAKKWDNLKRRYKDLKYPPVGMETAADGSSSWPWFHLMNEAMEGRLASSAPLLTPVTHDDDLQADHTPRRRSHPAPPPPLPPASSSDFGPEPFGGGGGGGGEAEQRGPEACEAPLGGLEREWELVERERAALEREREAVERQRASVERERAALAAERLWLERERAAVEQERAALDQRALMLNAVGHQGHLNGLM
ncbi:uncharacterized protein V6R79_001608 [Siganus canaliculatus]